MSVVEPCGATMDILRSCYRTMAVVGPGLPPEQITWWFTPADAPLAPRHQFGSMNWIKPLRFGTPLGEVEGASREWVTGKMPTGACGKTPPVTVECHPIPLPSSMYATLHIGISAYHSSLDYNAGEWNATFTPAGSGCGPLKIRLLCEEVIQPGGGFGWSWQLLAQTFDNAGAVHTSDAFGVPPTTPPFRIEADLPAYLAGCFPAGSPLPHLILTDVAPARRPLLVHV